MSKYIKMLMVVMVMTSFLVSCGSAAKIPIGMSKDMYNCGVNAIEVSNKLLTGEIDKLTAGAELTDILDTANRINVEIGSPDFGVLGAIAILQNSTYEEETFISERAYLLEKLEMEEMLVPVN